MIDAERSEHIEGGIDWRLVARLCSRAWPALFNYAVPRKLRGATHRWLPSLSVYS